ncbi:MAG TPA: hypothetical protein V6D04_11595 [Candidatus Obscuribacterales bacterium]
MSSAGARKKMKVQKDLSIRLLNLSLEFKTIEDELKMARTVDLPALQQFRHSLDDLRMTAWKISELINARNAQEEPGVVLSFLASERLRRFNQMTRDLSNDIDQESFTWESSGIQSLFDSLKILQDRLSSMVPTERA